LRIVQVHQELVVVRLHHARPVVERVDVDLDTIVEIQVARIAQHA
jgi:hypothetical protein